ncbi:hypothetical protein ACSYAD_06040 [Acaryochloris marina NIES-2412]|uniref:hypothetical protein n=1 Tax=Acaryochloris marina TaxID=155978 RepID=UPI004059FA4D
MKNPKNPASGLRGYGLKNIRNSSENFEVILAKADVLELSELLAEIFYGVVESDANIYDSQGGKHAVVLRFKGHTWSLFTFSTRRSNLSQTLSKELKTKCIFFGYSDTSDSGIYLLHDNGNRIEEYNFGLNYSEDEVPGWPKDTDGFQESPIIISGIPWHLIYTTPDQLSRYSFYSSYRKVTAQEIKDENNFLDSLFLSQDVWLPPLEYWLYPEFEPNLDLQIFETISFIAYRSIL